MKKWRVQIIYIFRGDYFTQASTKEDAEKEAREMFEIDDVNPELMFEKHIEAIEWDGGE